MKKPVLVGILITGFALLLVGLMRFAHEEPNYSLIEDGLYVGGDVERPPPTFISNPRTPPTIFAKRPTSLMAPCAQSSAWPQENAILNLRGRSWQMPLRMKCRVTACAYGVTSKTSPAATPL